MRQTVILISLSLAASLGLGAVACSQVDAGPAIARAEPGSAPAQAERAPPARPSQAAPAQAEGDPFPAGPYPDRDPALAKQLVDSGALLLDVRSAGEFEAGHIAGAINISHTQIDDRVAEIRERQGGDLHRPIVVYCRSGRRSGLAKAELEAAGFDRVTNLGGINEWPG